MPSPAAEFDREMMTRAIRLAMNGRGGVEPNPMVACVIAKDGRVIGEGFHAQFGGPHAEPTALAACSESPEPIAAALPRPARPTLSTIGNRNCGGSWQRVV